MLRAEESKCGEQKCARVGKKILKIADAFKDLEYLPSYIPEEPFIVGGVPKETVGILIPFDYGHELTSVICALI